MARFRSLTLVLFILSANGGLTLASDHPGNIYVVGEAVHATVPATWTHWRAVDLEGNEVGAGAVENGAAALGKLPIGYYEIRQQNGDPARVTAGVVAQNTPTEDTPIALDAAVAWFYQDPEQIRDACRLCRLAGVKWVRDRSSWPEIETARGTWAPDGRYERAMRIQHEMGLKVLQVNHISPSWATPSPQRFPDDLRDVYNFYRGLAERWKGLADEIEPWNEPDIELFGGHTGCEIASFQKAAYLGLKAGNSEQPVCGSCFAIDRAETLDEFGANEVYPYFDRYNLHHYIRLPDYPRAYGRHRAVSGGRPMWTTEFNLPVWWADEKTKEPSDEELRFQAYRVGKVFAQALYEGSEKAFYFILGDYVERQLQYGLVHTDLTPRPAYVAFAAVGRLLNGAKPIGRVDLGDEKLKAFAFQTEVDGTPRETIVAWSEAEPTIAANLPADNVYDHLGREIPRTGKVELTRATTFFVMPPGGTKDLSIHPPPEKAQWRSGNPCPVVLQLQGKGDFASSSFHMDATNELRLVAYNFGDTAAHGTLSLEGATASDLDISLGPGEHVERRIRVASPRQVTARLDLGDNGQAIVSARVTASTANSDQPQ